ncbi:MAG: MauE/DoxX family redox-associated membrane protein [Clostridia bacterium]
MEEVLLLLRFCLGYLFASTFFAKWNNLLTHESVVKEYQIVPKAMVRPFVRIDLLLQLCVAVSFLFGLFLPTGAVIAIILLVLYSAAIMINLARGRREISCGCGGLAGNHTLSWALVIRNVCLIASSALLFLPEARTLFSLEHYIFNGSLNVNWQVVPIVLASAMLALVGSAFQLVFQIRKEIG